MFANRNALCYNVMNLSVLDDLLSCCSEHMSFPICIVYFVVVYLEFPHMHCLHI